MSSFRFAASVCLALSVATTPMAIAQTWPDHPIRVVMPSPPGGGTDIITRMITEPLSARLGQSMPIEYKPGGNSVIGAQALLAAKPDGYTVMTALDMTATILPAVYRKLPFDPLKDIVPVAMLAKVPALFVAHPSVPASDLTELIAHSKANPGKLTYASAVLHGQLLGERLKSEAGLSYTYVPFKGAAEAMNALAGGHVSFMMLDIATGIKYINAGRLKALAITAPTRHPQLPDVKTVSEQGYPSALMSVWYGMFVPRGTPEPIINRLNSEIKQVLASPALRERLAELGHEVETMTPAQMTELVRKDAAAWAKAARDGNVVLD